MSTSLRKRMAEHGFESNDDYEFPVRALFAARVAHLRCLVVAGDSGRRKTAFAHALARALEYPHILYHDFTAPEPVPEPIVMAEDGTETPQSLEAPPSAFDRALTEACAFSEAERTVLILDQLQAAPFHDQIRLYQFAQRGEWGGAIGGVRANPKHLLLVLISETAIYHSLARVSYRVFTDASAGRFEFRPEDYGMGMDGRELFDRLAGLFQVLGSVPTPGEFERIVDDMIQHVRTEEQLRQTLYGWMERIDRGVLFSPVVVPELTSAVDALNRYLGLEEVELRDPSPG